jgi:MFS family permease
MSIEESSNYDVWNDYYLVIQGFFYLAQGIAMGAILFLPSFTRDLGLNDFESIVIQAVIWIPWFLKLIFGILSDNVPVKSYGRRKPYIFIAGIFGIIGWITLPLHTVFSVLFIISGILASFGTAMSDATIDALAVDVTPPRKRGIMQGVSWGSRGLGLGVSAIAVGILAQQGLWLQIYMIPGIIISVACFSVLLFKENPLPPDFTRVSLRTYGGVFKQKNVIICMLFQLISGAAISIVALAQTLFEEGLGFSPTLVGTIIAVFSVGMFIGAAMFGILGDKISVRITLPVTTLLYAIAVFLILILDVYATTIAMVYFFSVGFVNGGYEATQMRIGMDNSPSVVGGSIYNLYNSLSNLGQLAIGAIIIAAVGEYLSNWQLGWQLAILFLLTAMIPGLILARTLHDEAFMEEPEAMITPDM